MAEYHESWEALSEEDRNYHRALMSLKEEIEAVDWYHQRVALCREPALRDILQHNRDEEIEHAVMALEWLRRHVEGWDEQLRTYLFTDEPVTEVEEQKERQEALEESGAAQTPTSSQGRGLGIGKIDGED